MYKIEHVCSLVSTLAAANRYSIPCLRLLLRDNARSEIIYIISSVLSPQGAAKPAASAATQLINALRGAGRFNRNQASQQQLMSQCKVLLEKETFTLISKQSSSSRKYLSLCFTYMLHS